MLRTNTKKKAAESCVPCRMSGSIKGHRIADSNCDVELGKGGDGAVVMTTVQHNTLRGLCISHCMP